MWLPPVTIIFLTYATSSIKAVWIERRRRDSISVFINKEKKVKKTNKQNKKLTNFEDYRFRTLSLSSFSASVQIFTRLRQRAMFERIGAL